MTTYELWDLDDGNRIGEFDTEADALAVLRDILAESGAESVSPLALIRITDDEDPVLTLEGAAFIARVSSQVRPVA